jgi:hypothetical protein
MTPAPAAPIPPLALIGLVMLIAWRLYARMRRMIGRQLYRPARSWVSVILFPAVALLLLAGTVARPITSLAEVAGLVLGVALAVYGLRLTRFEDTPSGTFYTPNAHIGIALSALFAARVIYRMALLYIISGSLAAPPTSLTGSPLTLFIFGTLAGYYAWYALGLIRRRQQDPAADSSIHPASEAPTREREN